MIIIKIIFLYFIQIRHTDDFPSTGTRLVLVMELIGRKISTACSAEDCVRRRSCDRCRASGRIARHTGGVE